MSASFWTLVVVFVAVGLFLLFTVVNVLGKSGNPAGRGWLIAAGLFGVLLGWGAFQAGVTMTGQQVKLVVSGFEGEAIALPIAVEVTEQAGGSDGGGGPGGGTGMPGMGGGGGGGAGRRGPSSRRSLTTLVRKLDLLTGDVAVECSPKQAQEIGGLLAKASGGEKMTDEQAQAALEAVQAVLSDDQKGVIERIGLPRRRRSGGGGGGFGGGGEQGPPDENPFTEADNHKALVSLLSRFGVKPPEIAVKKTDEPPSREPAGDGDRGGR